MTTAPARAGCRVRPAVTPTPCARQDAAWRAIERRYRVQPRPGIDRASTGLLLAESARRALNKWATLSALDPGQAAEAAARQTVPPSPGDTRQKLPRGVSGRQLLPGAWRGSSLPRRPPRPNRPLCLSPPRLKPPTATRCTKQIPRATHLTSCSATSCEEMLHVPRARVRTFFEKSFSRFLVQHVQRDLVTRCSAAIYACCTRCCTCCTGMGSCNALTGADAILPRKNWGKVPLAYRGHG